MTTTLLVNDQYPDDRLKTSVHQIMQASMLCSMATVGPSGESHIHTAYFCFNDSLDLFFISDPTTTHGRNIARAATMAVAIFDTHQPWETPHRGLQLFGNCRLATLAESAKGLAAHAARFHAYGDYVKALNPFDREASVYKFYLFQADRIKIFDEPQFGEETFVVAAVLRG